MDKNGAAAFRSVFGVFCSICDGGVINLFQLLSLSMCIIMHTRLNDTDNKENTTFKSF